MQLWVIDLFIKLRSREGFIRFLTICRIAGVVAIFIRFFLANNPQQIIHSAIYWLYSLLTISIALFIIFRFYNKGLDQPIVHYVMIALDIFAINYFVWLTQKVNSEIYLLLLLPLVTSAHFLPRWQSFGAALFIIATYLVPLSLISSPGHTFFSTTLLSWFTHSLFLLAGTWLYRIQRNLPTTEASKIISPTQARAQLIVMLKELKNSVDFDTVSVQLLYRDQLQIVACLGFANPESIYQVEFPTNDNRYPNHLVMDSRRARILNPEFFPSFKVSQYAAENIKSWMGVPLISASTGDCFGMISLGSFKPDAFKNKHMQRAKRFAAKASNFLIEAALGPAALTLATKKENLENLFKAWVTEIHGKQWDNDLQAAHDLAVSAKKIFNVEDCSIFFLRHKYEKDDDQKVLHLVASSTIPPEFYTRHESPVTGRHHDGLTGLAVHRNRILNLGAAEIQKNPYRGGFTEHLKYFFSKRSRQIMIVPLRDSENNPTGAIKIENRLSKPSDHPFYPIECCTFELYAEMAGLILENIRQHNYINRQQQSVHNLRALLHPAAIIPIDGLLAQTDGHDGGLKEKLTGIRNTMNYTKAILDGILADSPESLVLENEGVIPALYCYIESLKSMPTLSEACSRISFEAENTRDDLPPRIRAAVYNIAREAILNMVRHAGIENRADGFGKISFSEVEDTYHMTIQDNGKGFSIGAKKEQAYCFGLNDMEKQLYIINNPDEIAALHIDSQPGQGTMIHLEWKNEK